ncbi:hydroxylamine reductase, partial [Candidatus Bathyarchaeota archaeon]
MFCFQCEQTANEKGCTQIGVCGKTPEVAALQDLLIYLLKRLSHVAIQARKENILDEKIDIFACKALFST